MACKQSWFQDEYDAFPLDPPKVTFVDQEAAQSFDCGVCLEKIKNAVAVCDDQLFQFFNSNYYAYNVCIVNLMHLILYTVYFAKNA